MKIIPATWFWLFLFWTNWLLAQSAVIDSLICFGIDKSIRQNYAIAESTFNQIINMDENHPRGYFFLAATLQSKMMDYETDLWESSFFSLLHKTEKHSNELIKQNNSDSWPYFYLGSAYSYRAFYYGKKHDYISAIKYAISGISALKKTLELDSTIYDVYFGLGSYKYWRSKLTRFLNWLPLLSDERDLGIKMVELSIQKGRYVKYAAINELIWILLDKGQVTEALKWAKLGLQRYPDSRFFLWGVAKSYYNLQQYNKALDSYDTILNSIQKEKFNNHYNETICYFKIAQCYFNLNQYEQAVKICEYIFTIKFSPEIKKRLKDILAQVQELYRNSLQKKS